MTSTTFKKKYTTRECRITSAVGKISYNVISIMNKGIIFDMDGVLIDAMLFHAEAMRLVYLLEGLPGSELVKEIFKREKIDEIWGKNNCPEGKGATFGFSLPLHN